MSTNRTERHNVSRATITAAVLVQSLIMMAPRPCLASFTWQDCGPADAPVDVTNLKVTPDPPKTPAPLAITVSYDATTAKITNLHGFLLFGGLALQLNSGPVNSDAYDGFVKIPATIPMAVSGFDGYEKFGLPGDFPIKAGTYGTPGNGVTFVYPDGPSLSTVTGSGGTKIDLTPTSLQGAELSITSNGTSGFPIPGHGEDGNYTAQVELLGPNGTEIGCQETTIAASYVECSENVSANPSVIWIADGRMIPVTVGIGTSPAGCVANGCMISSVSLNGKDAIARGDAVVTGDLTVNLKAKSESFVTGSLYQVALACTDTADSGTSNKSVSVVVLPIPF